MTAKERLHEIIDEMHEDQAVGLLYDLERRAHEDEELRAEIDRARAELRAGKGVPHNEAIRRIRASG